MYSIYRVCKCAKKYGDFSKMFNLLRIFVNGNKNAS